MEDVTRHDEEKHKMKTISHSPEWYKFWGNKCPDCGAEAEFIDENN